MNKQALAFISMFTLVLMLSIYYVSIDDTLPTISPTDNIENVIALMNEKNNEDREKKVLDLKSILSDSSSTEEKKKEVLIQIETITSNSKLSEELVELLQNNNIKSVIDIEGQQVNINVFEVEKSNDKADEILRLVYSKIKPNQAIELVFS